MPSLEALADSPHRVTGVVTAPDRPRGRGMKLDSPAVKKAAVEREIPVYQTPTLKTPESRERLKEFEADIFVVVAFGLILPRAVLEMTGFGCVNVHFSLLPLLRGAAPVQWALIQGHERTGVTIMQLDEGMDTGPVLARSEETIRDDDDVESLEQRLAHRGATLLRDVVDRLEGSEIAAEPQDDSRATYAPKISSRDAHLDWTEPAVVIRNKVRGLTPRPGAWGVLNGKRVKISRVSEVRHEDAVSAAGPAPAATGSPGTIHVMGKRILVETGSGWLALEVIQPEGRSRMSAAEFVRGYHPSSGDQIL